MPIDPNRIEAIIHEARSHTAELPWIEFKENNCNPEEIGECISALANTAALFGKEHAYMIWGIQDGTHAVVGTVFDPLTAKQGNQGIDVWISTQLQPQVQFYFHKIRLDGKLLVLLEIAAANASPVKFKSIDYIRIGANKKKLKDYPDTEGELWSVFSKRPFESLIAREHVPGDLVLRLMDYPAYFEMLSLDLPTDPKAILERLCAERMLTTCDAGYYNITNLGAILFARRLTDFPSLERKAMRVIRYNGNSRSSASKEQVGAKGYANGFAGLIDFINGMLPNNEVIGTALRKNLPMYPELAVRELVANAIIHQNFFIQGAGPMIEIFDNRAEITNPGIPLIDQARFVDSPPLSRNEALAGLMRRLGVCEERGSGFDKVVSQTEFYQLPAPEIEIYENHTRIILYAHKEFSKMSKQDRIRACYLHACLKRVCREQMTNASLRMRFEIAVKNSATISRLLADTCEAGLIKISEESASPKNRSYLPFWA